MPAPREVFIYSELFPGDGSAPPAAAIDELPHVCVGPDNSSTVVLGSLSGSVTH